MSNKLMTTYRANFIISCRIDIFKRIIPHINIQIQAINRTAESGLIHLANQGARYLAP